MIDVEKRCNFYFIPTIRFVFNLVFCPDCGERMRRVKHPHEPVFQCKCGWKTFCVLSHNYF
jgi:hypothetical protein